MKNGRAYYPEDDHIIRSSWKTVSYKDIAIRLHRTEPSIRSRAKKLMLRMSDNPGYGGAHRMWNEQPVMKHDYHAPPASLSHRLARPDWFDEDAGSIALRRKII